MERMMAGEAFDEVARAGSNEAQWMHRIRSLVLSGDDGVPDCLVLVLHDETERYSAEQRFERAFNANPAPALISRLDDLRHVRVNRGFLEMTGYREDVVMPGMGGAELGKAIRGTYPKLPVVLASGYSHVLAEEGLQGFQLLQKPYSLEEISSVLSDAAHGRRRIASLA